MPTPDYITVPVTTDASVLADDAFEYLETLLPGWSAEPGNLESWMIEATARIAGELAYVASQVPPAIFRYFGSAVMGIAPLDATAPSGAVVFHLTDTAGHTIPAGTRIYIEDTSGAPVAFQTLDAAVVASGSAVSGTVIVVAIEGGAAGESSTTAGMIDGLAYIDSIDVTVLPAGGTDAETDDEYLNRLREALTLLAPRPITAADFAALARTVSGVTYASAIDRYKADTDTFEDKAITVVVYGDSGPCSAGTKAAVLALFQSKRETNFLPFVRDPVSTNIDVSTTFTITSGADPATVEQAVRDSLTAFLSGPSWLASAEKDTKVRFLEVAQVINEAGGVGHIVTLTVNGGSADVTLTDELGVPAAHTLTIAAV